MQLRGWQRLGIVLSVVWALAAGIHTHNNDVNAAENYANFAYKVCTDGKSLKHDTNLSSCDRERDENLKTWMKDSNRNVAFAALSPIPFGWLAGFILLYVARAQIIGFRTVVQWRSLDIPKRAFVVFCGLSSIAVVIFGMMVVMNLYVDSLVPVALSPFVDVASTGDDHVTVKGTWTRRGSLGEGSSIAYPLQTSEIQCDRAENRCTEARASVSGTGTTGFAQLRFSRST